MLIVTNSARDSIKKVLESDKARNKHLVLYLQGAG